MESIPDSRWLLWRGRGGQEHLGVLRAKADAAVQEKSQRVMPGLRRSGGVACCGRSPLADKPPSPARPHA